MHTDTAHMAAGPFEGAGVRHIAGLRVPVRTSETALADILCAMRERRPMRIAFANTHLAYHALRDPGVASLLQDFHLLNDGLGLSLLSRISCGRGFTDNLNGTDLTPQLLRAAPSGTRVFLVGARPEVVFKTAHALRRLAPQIEICGVSDGYSAREDRRMSVVADIRNAAPHLVLVAMGNPLQETWIAAAAAHAPHSVYIGVGALFDFIANPRQRAPAAVRALRLEWLHRLAREPRRLVRRYTYEIAVLGAACLRERLRRSARARGA